MAASAWISNWVRILSAHLKEFVKSWTFWNHFLKNLAARVYTWHLVSFYVLEIWCVDKLDSLQENMTMIKPNPILPSPFGKKILEHLKSTDSSAKTISGLLEDLSTTARMNTWILITMIFMIFCIILLLMIRVRRSSSIDLWSGKSKTIVIRRWTHIKSCYNRSGLK